MHAAVGTLSAPAADADVPRDQAVPRVSAEIFRIPIDGAVLLYAPLRRAAFVANQRVAAFLGDLEAGWMDPGLPEAEDLVEFLRRLELLDAGEERRPACQRSGPPKPTSVTLFLTTACNLRCSYCYAAAGDTPTEVMPLSLARRGIDFVIGNAVEQGAARIELGYHGGGEPTLNWRTLVGAHAHAVTRAGEVGIGVHAALATNGVLDDARTDWILGHLQGASVSYDGLPEVHDARRKDLRGAGTAERVMRTLRRFEAAGFPYGLRLTVTREDLGQIEASVRYIVERLRPVRLQIEPAYQMGRWRAAPSAETEEFIEGFRRAAAVARASGLDLMFSSARLEEPTNHFCGVTQDNFCLTPSGHVSACYEAFTPRAGPSDAFLYGQAEPCGTGFGFDLARLEALRRESVEHREFCSGCFAKWSCAGDCLHKNRLVSGGGGFQGTDRCHITRELTKDRILERIRRTGRFFWHEPPPKAPAHTPWVAPHEKGETRLPSATC